MSKTCNLFLISLAICLFISTLGICKEDASRSKVPEWRVDYWGNDNIGVTYQECYGRFGALIFQVVATKEVYSHGEAAKKEIEAWAGVQNWANTNFIDHGLYAQIMTFEHQNSHTSQKSLRSLVKQLKIQLPVASANFTLWHKLGLIGSMEEKNFSSVLILLIDPYGRIASRSPDNVNSIQLEILPYPQMALETAEYWLERATKQIAYADKSFDKSNWAPAYKIYQPLADKVQAAPAGKIIHDRVIQIENSVRSDILDNLTTLTSDNTSKISSAIRKIQRSYKGTLLAKEAARHLAIIKRTKKDAELLDLIRLNVANTFTRMDRKGDAKAIYESLAAQNKEDENLQAELSLRITGKIHFSEKHILDINSSVEEWLQKAEGFFAEAEKFLGDEKTTGAQHKDTTVLLLAAAEHYTAAITNSERKLPGLRQRLTTVRAKLFWIASQE
ncbi:hypothetical protein ACFL54_05120 [Planctomycetota bacterium]